MNWEPTSLPRAWLKKWRYDQASSLGVVKENFFGLTFSTRVVFITWCHMLVCRSSNKLESSGIISGESDHPIIVSLNWQPPHFSVAAVCLHPFLHVHVCHLSWCIMIKVTIMFILCSSKNVLCFVYHLFNQLCYTDDSFHFGRSFDFIFPAGTIPGEVWVVCLPVIDLHNSRNVSRVSVFHWLLQFHEGGKSKFVATIKCNIRQLIECFILEVNNSCEAYYSQLLLLCFSNSFYLIC